MRVLKCVFLLSVLLVGCSDDSVSSGGSYYCQAKTQDGDRCKRKADEYSNYCWQHK